MIDYKAIYVQRRQKEVGTNRAYVEESFDFFHVRSLGPCQCSSTPYASGSKIMHFCQLALHQTNDEKETV